MTLSLKNVSKSYKDRKIIDDINLTISGNTIYCILGKNGAGKSTLINIIANLIKPDSGTISVNNLSYPKDEINIKKIVGLQTQFDQIIGELNASDYLEWIGLLYNMSKDDIAIQRENLLNYFFEEQEDLNILSKKYSEGMKKKLMICAATLHKPKLLILDEPFANLDPISAINLCNFLTAYKSKERIVFVSSHDLLYVDKIATYIGLLNNTQLIFNDTLSNFKENSSIDKELLKRLNVSNEKSNLLLDLIV